MSPSRFVPLGPMDSSPSSRAFLGYEKGPNGPLWPVVLVWVPEEVEEDPDRMAQLREDTARAVQIDHPNVIRVLGCEHLDEGYARVVEYPDAESLRTFLGAAAPRGGFPAPFLVRVIADAAAGIHHVHEMGQAEGNVRVRLHGALRPETLLVSFDGTTKVTGYGALAVAPRDVFGARLTPRLQYVSPEELEGGPGAADRRSDVYALTTVLYEAVAGRLPYRFDDPEFEQNVLSGNLPMEPLSKAPGLLREVIAKGLARKPGERFATAALLAQALESAGPCLPAQVAQICAELFPESGSERSLRGQLLREVGFAPGPLPRPIVRLPAPRPTPKSTLPAKPKTSPARPAALQAQPRPAAVAPTPSPQAAAPAPAAVAPAPPRTLTPPPARQGVPIGMILVGGLVVALLLAGGLFVARPDIWRALVNGTPVLPPQPVVVAPPPQPVAPVQPVAEVPPEPPPLPPPAPLPATLSLTSDPPLQVSVDGVAKGTTPVSVEVPAGEHRVRFRDSSMGVDVERTVHPKDGAHLNVPVKLSKASMEITAPDGSQVFLDGRLQGNAPVGELHFFEGHHSIKVKMGKAVFDKSFTAEAGQSLTLEVHQTP